MPRIDIRGTRLHYEDTGTGQETLVMSHGLLFNTRMFDAQVAAFKDRYRCVTFDFRGHGQSDIAADGYDIESLTLDTLDLLRSIGALPCHFAGVSMGGFVGMRLAVQDPALLRSLMLIETSADPEPAENLPKYGRLVTAARLLGLRLIAGRVMPIMFGRTFMADAGREDERRRWQQSIGRNNKWGVIRATQGVLTRRACYEDLDKVETPTLILIGEEDTATTADHSERMRDRIRGARLATIPRAGHSSPVEEPDAVNRAMAEFMDGLPR